MNTKVILVCGFAGSGKSTFTGSYAKYLQNNGKKVYVMNIDPAVKYLTYEPNLDIRDNVDYKGVMHDYRLGPNGAIMTCMNLFTSKIDQIMKILQGKDGIFDYILVDTPGQIEIFTWSAAGDILAKSFSSIFPDRVTLCYVINSTLSSTVGRNKRENRSLHASNILHACSVQYKMRLPVKLIFNGDGSIENDNDDGGEGEYEAEGRYGDILLDSIESVFEKIFESMGRFHVSAKVGKGYDNLLDSYQ